MSANYGRSVVIESNSLSHQNLSQIGKTLKELVLLSRLRVTDNQTFTHLMMDLVEDKTITQLIPLTDIQSKLFSDKYFDKLSNLRHFKSNENKSVFTQIISEELRQMEASIENGSELSSIELTYISGRCEDTVVEDICKVIVEEQINCEFLSMINILCIKSNQYLTNEPLISCPSGAMSRRQNFEISKDLKSMFETETIEEDEYAIDGYFKVWLHDLNRSSEKVRLFLDSDHNQSQEFLIKCDLKEAIFDLNNSRFNGIQDKSLSNNNELFETLPNICSNKCCYDLRIVGLVRSDGLCDTAVYGIPYILSATHSPNLTFTELVDNSHRFSALIQVMNEKNILIILELNQNSSRSLNEFYVLLSSLDTKTLVMKSIATKEQVLPYFNHSIDKSVPKMSPKVIDSVRQHLSHFPVSDIYNPLYVSKNLFQILSNNQ